MDYLPSNSSISVLKIIIIILLRRKTDTGRVNGTGSDVSVAIEFQKSDIVFIRIDIKFLVKMGSPDAVFESV